MDPGPAGPETPSKATFNTMPTTSNWDSAAFATPHGSGRHSTNHSQSSTPVVVNGGEHWTRNSHYGPAISGYNVSMVLNHLTDPSQPRAPQLLMDQRVQPQPMDQRIRTQPMAQRMQTQLMAQNRPMVPNYPVAQNQPNQHYHYTVDAPNNTAPRTRYQYQVLANGQPFQPTNEVRRPAGAQPMAQAVQTAQPTSQMQPAQPASPQQVTDADIEQVREWLEEDETTFQARFRNFQDAAKYREAERRIRQELTPELADDYPTDEAEQVELVRRLFNAFMVWDTDDHPGWTRQAINKVRLQANFIIELTAWHLLVFKALYPSQS